MNKAVLIVVEGGVADIRYVPPGVTVSIKDYDIENMTVEELNELPVDGDGEKFLLNQSEGRDHPFDKAAKKEAERLAAWQEGS